MSNIEKFIELFRQLIVIFFELESGKEISLKTRRDLLTAAYNVQTTKSSFDIRNEIVLVIKKFESELFSNSLISYICVLNLLKYFTKYAGNVEFKSIPEVKKLLTYKMNPDVSKDYNTVINLESLIGDVKLAEKKNNEPLPPTLC